MGASMYMKYDKDRKSIIFRFTFDKEADEISTRSLCSSREGRPHHPHSSIRKSSTTPSNNKSFFRRTTKRKKVAAVTTNSTDNNDGNELTNHTTTTTPIHESAATELQQQTVMAVVSTDDTSSTQSIETIEDLEDDFMCISNTIHLDTQTTCLLKPPATEVAVGAVVTAMEEGTTTLEQEAVEGTTSLEQEAIDYMDDHKNVVSSSSKSVTFASEVHSIQIPKFRDIPQLRQDLWFTKEELHQMKLANLVRSWRQ